ncbi:MraY family glycosyltransferase [Paenibacillus thermotolerans]|uniref:MraY family glycosyltransferase n=1 Tax=Paenibacillus thermotolerans TaxID=3027807 RepID=UPI0023674A6F|nr:MULTISPECIES: MraY family glycosyltransferase [unclassified Paenibacillus]
MRYAITLITALGTVYCLVPAVRSLALQYGFVDRPAARKIHKHPIPLLGGVAIYAGCMAALLLFIGWTPLTGAIVAGGAVLVAVGLVDDGFKTKGKEFPVWPRIVLYIAASFVPVWFGIQVAGVSRWFGGGMLMLPEGINELFTVIWIFALINMFNFIDGVDGLAAGIAAISSGTLFLVALLKGQPQSAAAAAVLAGAALAFLAYNFYPAKIFMGDAGATFLGYALAVVAVDGAFKSATALSILVPMLALGVPILDTAIVFTRRLIQGKGLHRADKLHTHHSLMHWGLSQRQTVSFLYLIGAVFSLLSIVLLLILA